MVPVKADTQTVDLASRSQQPIWKPAARQTVATALAAGFVAPVRAPGTPCPRMPPQGLRLHHTTLAVQPWHAIVGVVLPLDLLQPGSMWPKESCPGVLHAVEVVI